MWFTMALLAVLVTTQQPKVSQSESLQHSVRLQVIELEAIEELLWRMELSPAELERAHVAVADYQSEVTAVKALVAKVVQAANAEPRDTLSDESAPFNPITAPAPNDETKARQRQRTQAIVNGVVPHENRHRAALRRLIEQLEEMVSADNQSLSPRIFLLSRWDTPGSRNELDPKIIELNAFVANSMHGGTLASVKAALTEQEYSDFSGKLTQVMQGHNHIYAEHLTHRFLRPLKQRSDVQEPTEQLMTRSGHHWSERFDANHESVNQIWELIVAMTNTDAGNEWLHAYRKEVCAPIFKERWPLIMCDWLQLQPEATEAEMELARSLYTRYVAEIQHYQQRAYSATLAAARKTGFATVCFDESREHSLCHEALLALHVHGRNCLIEFRRGLAPELQTRLTSAWMEETREIAGPLPIKKFLSYRHIEQLESWDGMPLHWGW